MKKLDFKWRILAKLVVIYGLTLVCLVAPVTVSKFLSQAEESDVARVAKASMGKIGYQYTPIEMPETIDADQYGTYAFVAEFTVDFSECETCSVYSLQLKIGDTVSTDFFSADLLKNTSFKAVENPKTVVEKEVVSDGVANILAELDAFSNDKAYYYAPDRTGEYAWRTTDISSDGVLTVAENMIADIGEKHMYKVVYFVDIGASGAENSTMFYNLKCEQVN